MNSSPRPRTSVPRELLVFTGVAAFFAATVYFPQTLAPAMAASFEIDAAGQSAVTGAVQLSYGAAMLMIVPRADRANPRTLLAVLLAASAVAAFAFAVAPSAPFAAGIGIVLGLSAGGAQVCVVYASSVALAPRGVDRRARDGMPWAISGILLGVIVSRPVATTLAAWADWRAAFVVLGLVSAVLAVLVEWVVPSRAVSSPAQHPRLEPEARSVVRSALHALGSRHIWAWALPQSSLFAVQCAFWAIAPFLLTARLGGADAAVALSVISVAAVSGVVVSFLLGRVGRVRHPRRTHGLVFATGALGALGLVPAGLAAGVVVVVLLFLAAIVLDGSVAAGQTVAQREAMRLGPTASARANGAYMAIVYAGGALGSAVGGLLFQWFIS